ncbi:RNA polymerase II degradation factor 1 [Drosophila mojavensis]|uniref:Uncharacterized protein n=1 Tax=Drosophila mojavensis TaxID=7230 RepID=B4KTR2_DROMO|nr:RNA polymerase II degradation factor 1 [Drosophila mojavensis]EDW09645.1 uncharacterized protein Dmoj_GI20618 [Drosophila mojavensis]
MFETEDMLPRAAPRPSAPIPLGYTDEIVKPTVPEVSILFGQAPPQQAQLQQQQQQQQAQVQQQRPATFASWKKQVLPRVNFSPVVSTELGPATPPAATAVAISGVVGGNEYNFLPRSRAFDAEQASNLNRGYATTAPSHYPRETYASDELVPTPRLSNSNATATANDVLTICASTQTEAEPVSAVKDHRPEPGNLIDKSDIREVLTLLETMRQEQQQLRRLCESLAQQQQQQQLPSAKTFKETGTQCALLGPAKSNVAMVKRTTPIIHDYIVEEEELPARALPQFQSPRTAPPIAQSTGYRCNTPQSKQSPALPVKSNTDKTLVMNELALKYLPQRQINELMEDLRVSPKPGNEVVSNGTPLRAIDNFNQSPNNMSNASYKYLKKYRLLPEEQMGYDHHQHLISSPQARSQEPMLDLDNIRNQPKLL